MYSEKNLTHWHFFHMDTGRRCDRPATSQDRTRTPHNRDRHTRWTVALEQLPERLWHVPGVLNSGLHSTSWNSNTVTWANELHLKCGCLVYDVDFIINVHNSVALLMRKLQVSTHSPQKDKRQSSYSSCVGRQFILQWHIDALLTVNKRLAVTLSCHGNQKVHQKGIRKLDKVDGVDLPNICGSSFWNLLHVTILAPWEFWSAY